MPHSPAPFEDELTFSFETIGESTKVTATDPVTGVEISLVAPSSVTQTEMRREATTKLAYVLSKRAQEGEGLK